MSVGPSSQKSQSKSALFALRGRQQLKRDLEHITQEMYRRNRELAETNKTLSLLRAIDALVLESHEPLERVCAQIAHTITDAADYPFVGILTRSLQFKEHLELSGLSIRAKPLQNHLPGILHPVYLDMNDSWYRNSDGTRLISLGAAPAAELGAIFNCSESEATHLLAHLPLQTVYFIKLTARHKLAGAILVGFSSPVDQLLGTDTLLIDRLSESIGVALDNKLLAEENRHVLRQLKESNAKLRALDQTKDDFISMASHQLRTPLTSVKGYLSLVLDGDAGSIKPSQRKLLTQAFISSQRMVYLIADLLNVSRLRTGKFIIESTPVNLASIVQDEVDQLVETAEGRSLRLTYHKPEQFPVLNLDETKIRQVIMNFIDNAIYYTPSGGHIDVVLSETEKSIELHVVDDGIGVPKAEAHHLFTKFFRAKNAQRARPDGTGLGLFMAQKVVVAQGGAIIFSSKEGHGSTFGFTLPKEKLSPKPAATHLK